jgi:hypothetical protein
MTVLILGAVYWFWTQNQFMLRKLNLLENIVYEMKMALSTESSPPAVDLSSSNPTNYAPAPGSVMSDDDADMLNNDLQDTLSPLEESPITSAGIQGVQDSPVLEVRSDTIPVFNMPEHDASPVKEGKEETANDDLQPGGVGSGLPEAKTGSSAYDAMTLRELRKLAENRAISGAKDMRKQALIDALRNTPAGVTFDVTEGVLDLN